MFVVLFTRKVNDPHFACTDWVSLGGLGGGGGGGGGPLYCLDITKSSSDTNLNMVYFAERTFKYLFSKDS